MKLEYVTPTKLPFAERTTPPDSAAGVDVRRRRRDGRCLAYNLAGAFDDNLRLGIDVELLRCCRSSRRCLCQQDGVLVGWQDAVAADRGHVSLAGDPECIRNALDAQRGFPSPSPRRRLASVVIGEQA